MKKKTVTRRLRIPPPRDIPQLGSVWEHRSKMKPCVIVKHGRNRGDSTYVYYVVDGSKAKTPSCAGMSWFIRNYKLVHDADPAGV